MSEREPFKPQRNEVVLDYGNPVDGKPLEGVYVGPGWSGGTVELRPVGFNDDLWQTPEGEIGPCTPRQVAPGTGGNPHRRPLDGEPV
ncbi:hypothetical protein ABTZ03_09665 [Kitasatospora sp. NPDC096077]|uniref:hypothetical protein n=1 Tax=Kitasatospora sp. NPDC096077 TaxID=3155544 RepID=UPI0033235828